MTRSCATLNSFSIASSVSLLLADSAAIICDAARLPLAMTLPSWSTVRAASAASSAERLADCRMALIWVWASIIAGLAAATKPACARRSASYCLSCSRSDAKPFARRRAEALDVVVDVLHGFGERSDHRLVGAEFDDLAELFERDLLGFLHLPGAFVQRLIAFGGEQRRSLAGKACALGGKLQAGREPRDVPSAQIDHAAAEMSQHHGGAGADDEGHARDHREGGKQAAPDAPARAQKAQDATKLADRVSLRHAVPAR